MANEADDLLTPQRGEERLGPVKQPALIVGATGYGIFNTLSLEIVAEVGRAGPLGTGTPAYAQISPVAAENLLCISPCRCIAPKRFSIRWYSDRERAAMRLRNVLQAVDVALRAPATCWSCRCGPTRTPSMG